MRQRTVEAYRNAVGNMNAKMDAYFRASTALEMLSADLELGAFSAAAARSIAGALNCLTTAQMRAEEEYNAAIMKVEWLENKHPELMEVQVAGEPTPLPQQESNGQLVLFPTR